MEERRKVGRCFPRPVTRVLFGYNHTGKPLQNVVRNPFHTYSLLLVHVEDSK